MEGSKVNEGTWYGVESKIMEKLRNTHQSTYLQRTRARIFVCHIVWCAALQLAGVTHHEYRKKVRQLETREIEIRKSVCTSSLRAQGLACARFRTWIK